MEKRMLSVVIPAYNEARNFSEGHLENAYNYLTQQSYPFEMILVDDGSTDDTLSRLHEFADERTEVRVIANTHQGKARTVQTGMLSAQGSHRLFTDFDQSTPISELEKLLPFRNKKYDVVIGSREVKGSKREDEPWYRHLMGKGFNLVVQIFAVRGIRDTQCGFKLFSGDAAEDLFGRLKVTDAASKTAFTGAFDVELLFLATKLGYKIAEVPVYWKHVESVRVNPVKDSLRMFVEVVKIRLTDLAGGYRA
jgi:dolichyl-phosphate beta-glucosyltransferase